MGEEARGSSLLRTVIGLLAVALMIISLIAVETAPASSSGGPAASAAKKKKKCTKQKRKKGKCGKKAGDDIAQATALFAGSRFVATGCTSTTNCNTSYTNTINFCTNGTYNARFEKNNDLILYTTVTQIAGSWRFSAANVAAGSGTLNTTIDQFYSSNGDPQPAHDQVTQVQASSTTSFNIGGVEYTRTAGGAGC